ncbi:ligand-binding protein SH3 [Brevibacterium litoralis]|uniref:ligand-binding protein SH3 n=1 Tax=Brevibacterium litoralis TaxID=3138935 RepID=UPI0032EDE5B9
MGKHSDHRASWKAGAAGVLRGLAGSADRADRSGRTEAHRDTTSASARSAVVDGLTRRERIEQEELRARARDELAARRARRAAKAAAVGYSAAGDSEQVTTATGVLRTVRRRPMVAAIALPAAATAAIVAGAVGLSPSTGTVTAQPVPEGPQATATASAVEETAAPEIATLVADSAPVTEDEKDSEKGSVETSVEIDEEALAAAEEAAEAEEREQMTEDREAIGATSDRSAARESGGVSNAPCSVSSSIESSISTNAQKVYRAVCAEFPEVSSYGGVRNDPGSDHHTGHAVDIMITGSTGDAIAEFVLDNASELGIKYVIWEQAIAYPGGGWSGMSDRGGATANHYDHVHVSVH